MRSIVLALIWAVVAAFWGGMAFILQDKMMAGVAFGAVFMSFWTLNSGVDKWK